MLRHAPTSDIHEHQSELIKRLVDALVDADDVNEDAG